MKKFLEVLAWLSPIIFKCTPHLDDFHFVVSNMLRILYERLYQSQFKKLSRQG